MGRGFWLRASPSPLVPSPETAGLSFHVASLDESGLLNVWVSRAHGQWWGTGGDVCGRGGRAGGDMYVRGGRALSQEPGRGSLQGTPGGTRDGRGQLQGLSREGRRRSKSGIYSI